MKREAIQTDEAPQAIGTYSQAVRAGSTVYLSGQLPRRPGTGEHETKSTRAQIIHVFKILEAVTRAAGGSLDLIVKLNVYLTDLANFPVVNEVMADYFRKPYPARAAVGVADLPKGASVEMDAIMVLEDQ